MTEDASDPPGDSSCSHPSDFDGDAVRRQIEYYFSNENLPTDRHLLSLCGGGQNLPVSIGEILGWRKMRPYRKKRKLVTAALKESEFLEVCENDKRVRRKTALVLGDLVQEQVNRTVPTPAQPLPAHLTKNMVLPTGFEDSYCDPPVTPAEHAVQAICYDPELPLSQRVEAAIQRYQSKRKFHQDEAHVFTSFLKYGGIDCEPKAFGGGLSAAEMADMDAAEIALAKATLFCSADKDDEELWTVDFEGVARGYLSSYFPDFVYKGRGPQELELVTRVLINFYNYLMHHDVCPEFTADLLAARSICLLAKRELPAAWHLRDQLPGPFNEAVSVLTHGFYDSVYGDRSWDTATDVLKSEGKNMQVEQAKILLLTGIAAQGSPALLSGLNAGSRGHARSGHCLDRLYCVKNLPYITLEVVAVEKPSSEVIKLYAQQTHSGHSRPKLQPLGKLMLRSWQVPDYMDKDLPPRASANQIDPRCKDVNTYELWLEASLLVHFSEGLRICCTLREIALRDDQTASTAFWHIDTFHQVYCSFYECLLNELSVKAVPVRYLPIKTPNDMVGAALTD